MFLSVVGLIEMVKQSMENFRTKLAIFLLRRPDYSHGHQKGFTLLELLVVIAMVGVLASIAAPGWLGYLDRRRVVTTQDNVFSAIRSAQTRAQERRQEYQFSIREEANDVIEWAVHASTIDPTTTGGIAWEESLSDAVEINTVTTFEVANAGTPAEYHFIRFDYKGNVNIPAGGALPLQLTLSSVNAPGDDASDLTAKSIVVQTILGTLRKE